MSIKVDVRGDVLAAVRGMDSLAKRAVPASTVSALNRTAAHAKTHAARALRDIAPAPVAKLKSRIKLVKAKRRRLAANVVGLVLPIRASDLGAGRQTRTGVTVKGRTFPGAFKAQVGGKPGIMRRRGRSRLPIVHEHIELMPAAQRILARQVRRSFEQVFPVAFKKDFAYRARKYAV